MASACMGNRQEHIDRFDHLCFSRRIKFVFNLPKDVLVAELTGVLGTCVWGKTFHISIPEGTPTPRRMSPRESCNEG